MLLFSSSTSWGGAAETSPLAESPSPYLQMHAEDPVQWQIWDSNALKQAKKQERLIFISSGYFACHWCHVMQRESFQNPEISKILNRSFVAVKVDRELSSVVDQDLIDFVRKTTGHSGWPLQVILLPDGTPLFGFVYIPPERLRHLLLRLEKRWLDNPAEMSRLARNVVKELNEYNKILDQPNEDSNGNNLPVDKFLADADMLSGGFGEQNKFPVTPHLLNGLSLYGVENELLKEFLTLTLDNMATLGLHDSVEGGFFRYTIDPDWSTPHFEKMLYDNAQLAQLYLRAGTILQRADYRSVGRETIDFMVQKMRTRDGMFISSLSAVDGDGIEGGYYLLDLDILSTVLDDNEQHLFDVFWLPQNTSIDGVVHLFMPDTSRATPEQLDGILNVRKKLQQLRLEHTLPEDRKILSGWNGLVLTALSELLQNEDSPGLDREYRAIGDKLAETLVSKYWDGKQLLRLRHKSSSTPALLEDYGYVAEGLFRWGEVTSQDGFINAAGQIVDVARENLYKDGKWQATDRRLLKYSSAIVTKTAGEALPSPPTVLKRVEMLLAPEQEISGIR